MVRVAGPVWAPVVALRVRSPLASAASIVRPSALTPLGSPVTVTTTASAKPALRSTSTVTTVSALRDSDAEPLASVTMRGAARTVRSNSAVASSAPAVPTMVRVAGPVWAPAVALRVRSPLASAASMVRLAALTPFGSPVTVTTTGWAKPPLRSTSTVITTSLPSGSDTAPTVVPMENTMTRLAQAVSSASDRIERTTRARFTAVSLAREHERGV